MPATTEPVSLASLLGASPTMSPARTGFPDLPTAPKPVLSVMNIDPDSRGGVTVDVSQFQAQRQSRRAAPAGPVSPTAIVQSLQSLQGGPDRGVPVIGTPTSTGFVSQGPTVLPPPAPPPPPPGQVVTFLVPGFGEIEVVYRQVILAGAALVLVGDAARTGQRFSPSGEAPITLYPAQSPYLFRAVPLGLTFTYAGAEFTVLQVVHYEPVQVEPAPEPPPPPQAPPPAPPPVGGRFVSPGQRRVPTPPPEALDARPAARGAPPAPVTQEDLARALEFHGSQFAAPPAAVGEPPAPDGQDQLPWVDPQTRASMLSILGLGQG